MRYDAYGDTHIGLRRSRNEDRLLIKHLADRTLLLAVADGMGGEARGDLAAQMTVDVVDEVDRFQSGNSRLQLQLSRLVTKAGARIQTKIKANPDLESMGTTLTLALLTDTTVHWAHVGDSRLYLLHNGSLKQVSKDHTFVQDFLDDGSMTPEQAAVHPLRNMLDQCVGCTDCTPDSGSFDVTTGDTLLLCSDGLTRHVNDPRLAAIIQDADSAQQACHDLIQAALDEGGKDNVTAVVVRVLP